MTTLFTTSLDGTRLAYDRHGAGPALLLLPGGGARRQEWHHAGYVQRLQDNFTVITFDLRGHGESDQPTEPAAYTIDKMMQDVLAVADACETVVSRNHFTFTCHSCHSRPVRWVT